ncbi:MAG: FAD-dependent oxidoreductase [Bacteroidales bacterium]|nr:FAD-dependent oxidoreductase [Bacteroidales bacterium]
MIKITSHPILDIPQDDEITFNYNGVKVKGQRGFTIAAALHQAGYPIHSHSLKGRSRSLECGIGKCGACEMLVDGFIKRICITKVDNVSSVEEIPHNFLVEKNIPLQKEHKVYKTQVLIIGAGPSGLAVREELNKLKIDNLVIDSNDKIGGQFTMQTHQFFFFEKQRHFGGMRGFDIAKTLAGNNEEGILLNSSVWDILEDNRVGVKNTYSGELFYIDCEHLVVATGAVPFMPVFKNDDLPGVYTAAVIQKMMNSELTLLGKNILTVGAGNIGYLTSYQAMQAGANVVAILEAMPTEGGFPVQANRVRRLGIPIMTSTTLLEAIPNEKGDGIKGAIIADCENFQPISGTERVIEGIDVINVCTGLIPDDQLLTKGNLLFGKRCHGVGDAVRIGEGTSAVLRGKQCAYEIAKMLNVRTDYDEYLSVSKDYIESQQHPVKVLDKAFLPNEQRQQTRAFVRLECLYGFACNPCQFACKYGAITKQATNTTPQIDYDKCIGCMECVSQCPGLAIFGYNTKKQLVYLPFEYEAEEKSKVFLVDNNGVALGEGVIERIKKNTNKTSVATISVGQGFDKEKFLEIKGFVPIDKFHKKVEFLPPYKVEEQTFVCHCEDVTLDKLLSQIGDRKVISVDELKHTTRMGMGDCRGKRCIPRAKQMLRAFGITVTDEATPRAPLSLQLSLGEMRKDESKNIYITPNIIKKDVKALILGGGIAGSALYRYFAENSFNPVLINYERGASWRNIAGGRPAFSNPELADIAKHNHEMFIELQNLKNIDYYPTRYVNLAHDEKSYKGLEQAMQWSDAYMVSPKDFQKEISPYFNKDNKDYIAAQITRQCWQATPGKTIDLLRNIGTNKGGEVIEGVQVVELSKEGETYKALVKDNFGKYTEYSTKYLVNALGYNAEKFAKQLGIQTGLYPVKHQAFITKRTAKLGIKGNILDMVIDRRQFKGFSSIYGQQLNETGQIIGCASPMFDPQETKQELKINSLDFINVVSEVFSSWIPELKNVSFQALWSGYYTEPRYIIDPALGLFIGLRGHGFMLSQYLAKLYVDSITGKNVPSYFNKLALDKEGISETALK